MKKLLLLLTLVALTTFNFKILCATALTEKEHIHAFLAVQAENALSGRLKDVETACMGEDYPAPDEETAEKARQAFRETNRFGEPASMSKKAIAKNSWVWARTICRWLTKEEDTDTPNIEALESLGALLFLAQESILGPLEYEPALILPKNKTLRNRYVRALVDYCGIAKKHVGYPYVKKDGRISPTP
ncbi:hypothetical protein HN446_00980 [bacterium]|nr:hypothetical protein [bacterium]